MRRFAPPREACYRMYRFSAHSILFQMYNFSVHLVLSSLWITLPSKFGRLSWIIPPTKGGYYRPLISFVNFSVHAFSEICSFLSTEIGSIRERHATMHFLIRFLTFIEVFYLFYFLNKGCSDPQSSVCVHRPCSVVRDLVKLYCKYLF